MYGCLVCGRRLSLRSIGCTPALYVIQKRRCSCGMRRYISVICLCICKLAVKVVCVSVCLKLSYVKTTTNQLALINHLCLNWTALKQLHSKYQQSKSFRTSFSRLLHEVLRIRGSTERHAYSSLSATLATAATTTKYVALIIMYVWQHVC